jgi:hypothetical protein
MQGTLLTTKFHPADVHAHAHAGAELLLSGLQHFLLATERMCADVAYRGLENWLGRAHCCT